MSQDRLFRIVMATAIAVSTSLFVTIDGIAAGGAYFIRTDGGSAAQCTGLVNAPYPGSGANQPCAWDHPFRALPPGGTPQIVGGDTLIIAAGQYRMGYGAPGTGNCDAAGSFDCVMSSIPSGPDAAHPTRILGAGWAAGCSTPPQLWGAERPWFIVNMTDTSNVELNCLEITDHSSCVESYSGSPSCQRDTFPYGAWASYGLYAQDSSNALLRNLNVHGLASGGVHAGRLTDWTVENVRIAGNGSVGWDGDLWSGPGDSNSGTMTFRHWTVEWNGCGEAYPAGTPFGCWSQEAGGYGDGVGTGATGANWVIEDSSFLHNTSDGLDLFYHTLGGSVTINRVRAEGNAGNQIKVTGQTQITNSVLVGNCAFFEGKAFTYWTDPCRALGATVELAFAGGEQDSIVNSTIYGQGDGLVGGGNHPEFACNGTETISAQNSIFLGDTDYFDSTDISFLFYQEGCAGLQLDSNTNDIYNTKNVTCGASETYVKSGVNDLCADPLLIGPLASVAEATYNMTPGAGSPAIDAGDTAICAATPVSNFDQLYQRRPIDGDGDGIAACDMGALEAKYPIMSLTSYSVAANDGWILQSSETSDKGGSLNRVAATLRLGDDRGDRQYRAILHFDTSTIPANAVIVGVQLKLERQGVVGTTPFTTHGDLLVDTEAPYFGSRRLQRTDFQVVASESVVRRLGPGTGNWYVAALNGSAYSFVKLSDSMEFRVRFARGDNDDGGADYVKFYSGNARAELSPQLVVQYYVP